MARGPKKAIGSKANRNKSQSQSYSNQNPRSNASVARFNNEVDIPMDDQDLFHKQRDQILLGGNDELDDQDDDDAFNGQREILGLDDEMSQDSQESEEEEDEEEVEDSLPTKKQFKSSSSSQPKPSNYESVTEDEEDEEEEEDLDRGWGSNKRSYFGTNNLDNLDSEDSELDEEEARELELNEVKRLQAKSRKGMNDEDFGLGEDGLVLEDYKDDSIGGKKLGDRQRRRLELDEGLDLKADVDDSGSAGPSTLPSDPSARSALLAQVQKTSPETIALAGEYADVVEELERVEAAVKKATEQMPNHPSLGLMHLHHQTLVTYVTTIAYYFYLRSLPQYSKDPSKLSKHAVMGRLVKLKTALSAMDDLGLSADAQSDDEEGLSDEEDEVLDLNLNPEDVALPESDLDSEDLGSLEEDELSGLMDDQTEDLLKEQEERKESSKASKSKKGKEKATSSSSSMAQDQEKPKKNKKKSSLKRKAEEVEEPAPLSNLADLEDDEDVYQDLSTSNKKKKSKKTNNHTESSFESAQAFGEPTTLSKSDQAEKSARKKSLQFYTGQISSKDARREAASKAKLTGDADIPYRDRDRSREGVNATLANKAAKANGINTGNRGLDNDGDDWNEEDKRDWRDVMGVEDEFGEGEKGAGGNDDDDGDDYYDLVASGKRKAKKQKKEEYEEAREAERYVPDDSIEEGGHRSINRQIEKNRGLTPRRPKAVRNPRVKKRQKFDKATKKLGSVRAVFKGGQSSLQGGYEGEKSGISSHLVKSRSFGK